MLSEKMQHALNEQINAELYSSYLYLSMSAWFESISLGGFSKWMQAQAQEELMHAMKAPSRKPGDIVEINLLGVVEKYKL